MADIFQADYLTSADQMILDWFNIPFLKKTKIVTKSQFITELSKNDSIWGLLSYFLQMINVIINTLMINDKYGLWIIIVSHTV